MSLHILSICAINSVKLWKLVFKFEKENSWRNNWAYHQSSRRYLDASDCRLWPTARSYTSLLQKQNHWLWNVLRYTIYSKNRKRRTKTLCLTAETWWLMFNDFSAYITWRLTCGVGVLHFGQLDMLQASKLERQAIEPCSIAHQW